MRVNVEEIFNLIINNTSGFSIDNDEWIDFPNGHGVNRQMILEWAEEYRDISYDLNTYQDEIEEYEDSDVDYLQLKEKVVKDISKIINKEADVFSYHDVKNVNNVVDYVQQFSYDLEDYILDKAREVEEREKIED